MAALIRKESLSQRINKDDIKFLLPNFKKRDREAIKDIEPDAGEEDGCVIPDDTGNPAIESEDINSKVEVGAEPDPPATQPGLF